MKVAIVSSRGLKLDNLEQHIPPETTEIVLGWEMNTDFHAYKYAIEHNLKFKQIPLHFCDNGKKDFVRRNVEIIEYSDFVLIFWDGKSRGTCYMINKCKHLRAMHKIITVS